MFRRSLDTEEVPEPPTAVELTPEIIERAATAILACEAEKRLTDCYGDASRKRARIVAKAALVAALDLRRED